LTGRWAFSSSPANNLGSLLIVAMTLAVVADVTGATCQRADQRHS